MLITESQLSHSINALNLLENMTYLNESESNYHPAMVPVVENTTIGKNIIYVRGLMEMTESMNDGESFAQAICEVLDANQLETSSSILAVDEASVYEHPEILSFIEYCGMDTAVLPISDKDFVYRLTEAVVNEVAETGDMNFLLEFMGDDFERKATTKIAKWIGVHDDKTKTSIATGMKIGHGGALTVGGATAGSYLGGSIGSAIAPGIGTVAGCYIGGFLGAIPGYVKMIHDGDTLEKVRKNKSGEGILYDPEDAASIDQVAKTAQQLSSQPNKTYISKKLASLTKQSKKWEDKSKNETDTKKKQFADKMVQTIKDSINVCKKALEKLAKGKK